METKREKLTIGILLICTGKYDIFMDRLLEGINTHFFPADEIIVYLFGDKPEYTFVLPSRMSIVIIPTKHEPWPMPTLMRYRHFTNAAKKIAITDFVFYTDIDMMVVGDVTDEILSDLICTRHPGFWNNSDWGSPAIPTNSTSYLREDERHRYVAGGFQGGQTDKFLEMSRILADNIDEDYKYGIIAQHNDESHFNQFVNKQVYQMFPDWKVKDLSPSYCMLPEEEAKVKFGLDGLPSIIIALSKNHEELRNP